MNQGKEPQRVLYETVGLEREADQPLGLCGDEKSLGFNNAHWWNEESRLEVLVNLRS